MVVVVLFCFVFFLGSFVHMHSNTCVPRTQVLLVNVVHPQYHSATQNSKHALRRSLTCLSLALHQLLLAGREWGTDSWSAGGRAEARLVRSLLLLPTNQVLRGAEGACPNTELSGIKIS